MPETPSMSWPSITLLGLSVVSVAALAGSDGSDDAPDASSTAPVASDTTELAQPMTLTIRQSATADGAASDPANGNQNASPTISGTLSRPLLPTESLIVTRSGLSAGEPDVNGTQWTFSDALRTDDTYAYRIELIDKNGRPLANSETINITVDTTAPQIPTLNAVERDNQISPAEAADGVLLSGVSEAGTTITVNWDGDIRTDITDVDGDWEIFYDPLPVDAGRAPVRVTATDEAGNTSDERFRFLTVQSDVSNNGFDDLAAQTPPAFDI